MVNTFWEPCPDCPEAGVEKGVGVFPGQMVRWASGKRSPLESEGAVDGKLCLRNSIWCEGLLDQQATQRRWLSLGRRPQLRAGRVWKWSRDNSDTMEGDLPEIQSELTTEERRKSNWRWCWRSLSGLKLGELAPVPCCVGPEKPGAGTLWGCPRDSQAEQTRRAFESDFGFPSCLLSLLIFRCFILLCNIWWMQRHVGHSCGLWNEHLRNPVSPPSFCGFFASRRSVRAPHWRPGA